MPVDLQTPLRIALCGTGRIGAVHFKSIIGNPRFELAYIVDIDENHAASFVAQAPGCKYLKTIDEALKDEKLAGVVVCTPTADHKAIILAAVQAGKAVMCEKPISLKLEEIDECYQEAKKHNVPLFCAYQRRSDPSFVKVFEACKRGDLGQVQIVKTISRDNPVPSVAYLKISGGIFHDCGSHDIDLCRWVTGEDPSEVFAAASAFREEIKAINDFDTILITLKFPSGIVASIDLSRKAAYGYDQRLEVLGSQGMAQAENRKPTTFVLHNDGGVHTDPNCYSFPQRYDYAYAAEIEHFADVITRKCEPKLSHEDARKVSIIADAAEESARKGERVFIKY